MTYADVGDRAGAHEITISNLANGKQKLTQEWMTRLAKVFSVRVSELLEAPAAKSMRRIQVRGALNAGAWQEGYEWSDDDQYDVLVPDEPALRGVELYAAQISGPSMNLRYPEGSIVILSPIAHSATEISPGRRYHVRRVRADGLVEETIKTLERGSDGHFWLKPESTNPEFQEWIPLEGLPGETIELVGRVRFTVRRED